MKIPLRMVSNSVTILGDILCKARGKGSGVWAVASGASDHFKVFTSVFHVTVAGDELGSLGLV